MHEPEGEQEANDGDDEFAQTTDAAVEKGFDVAADEALRQEAERSAEHILGEINGDGIHAHPNERLAPPANLQHIDDKIERAQQDCAVAAGDEDEGGGPDFFGDRKLEVPE